MKLPNAFRGLLGRKARKRRPPSGNKGLLGFYNPKAPTRSLAYLPEKFPLRHHTVRFVNDSKLDFETYLKAEVASYKRSVLTHEPGSPVASIKVLNPAYDAEFDAQNGGGLPPELLRSLTERLDLLPVYFDPSRKSFTIHYREEGGVFFKSALKDVHSYPLRQVANRIKSYQENDFVAKITAEGLPSSLRDAFLASVAKQVQPRLQRHDAEAAPPYQARLAFSQLKLQAVSSLIRDVRYVTVKISGLRPQETIHAELKLEARPGTKLARLLQSTRRRRPEAASETTSVFPAMSLQLNSVSAVREFLRTQLQAMPKDLPFESLSVPIEASLSGAESLKLRLLQLEKQWVLSVVADGKMTEPGEKLISSLNASEYLKPSGSTDDSNQFSINTELQEKHQFPEALAVSIKPERLHVVVGPSSKLSTALALPIAESAAVFNVSADLHALCQLDPDSIINPRIVIRAAEKAMHQMMLSSELPADYGKRKSADEKAADEKAYRQLFAARMKFDHEHHGLTHLFDAANSKFHLSAHADATSLQLRIQLGRAIFEAIEARNVLVSQLVLADKTRRFWKLTPSQLLDEIESTGLKIPQELRNRVSKAGDEK